MALIGTVKTGLETALKEISGLTVYKHWPGQVPKTPAAIVRPFSGRFQDSMGTDNNPLNFKIHLLGGPVEALGLEKAQEALDPFLSGSGAKSVFAKLEASRTLGGVAHTLRVIGWSEYDVVEVGTIGYAGAAIDVMVDPV
jgi:hypothetical protein